MLYHLFFYVPESHLESVKQAIFAAGAGKYDRYDQCCWEIIGQGQFRALAGSQPFLGQQNHTKLVAEYRVETICDASVLRNVIAALKTSHPYEIPAYGVVKLEDV